jgi:hypothetical protein
MTNLERAAALAATWGMKSLEPYRSWSVYSDGDVQHAVSPYEMDWEQFCTVSGRAKWLPLTLARPAVSPPLQPMSLSTYGSVHAAIDAFEAARSTMPASAFFGVEAEAL